MEKPLPRRNDLPFCIFPNARNMMMPMDADVAVVLSHAFRRRVEIRLDIDFTIAPGPAAISSDKASDIHS